MYVDLHGHSRKQNVFMYGCDDKKKPRPAVRVFPKLLAWNRSVVCKPPYSESSKRLHLIAVSMQCCFVYRLGQNYVSFKDCSFHVKKNRETTARVVVARELNIRNSYTLEATFCGADFGPLQSYHFNTQHLQQAGMALCDALIDYLVPNPEQRESMLSDPLITINSQPDELENVVSRKGEGKEGGMEERRDTHVSPSLVKLNIVVCCAA